MYWPRKYHRPQRPPIHCMYCKYETRMLAGRNSVRNDLNMDDAVAAMTARVGSLNKCPLSPPQVSPSVP